MSSIDYPPPDPLRDPPGSQDYYTERLAYLTPTAQCFRPSATERDVPAGNPPPCLSSGYVTFGSLNKPLKAGPEVVSAWARILAAVRESRLIVLATGREREGRLHSPLAEALIAAGVERNRVVPVPVSPHQTYLERYRDIDIALDPWPFNGHTTTLDAIWMGVPVVALEGATHLARESSSVLTLIGLDDYVARSVPEYVELAVRRAIDTTALANLRAGLRGRLRGSPLYDARAVTREVERAYRRFWRDWCEKR
jgi:predicted O-linked N-acetylglucosamine transferase (SPINDLY family)